LSNNIRYGFPANSATLAVVGRKPNFQKLCPLAGVTREATKGDVFTRDNSRVVDDMFPSRRRLSRPVRIETHHAINAFRVTAAYFRFKRRGNVPTVRHHPDP
jgi:hypothetical protein